MAVQVDARTVERVQFVSSAEFDEVVARLSAALAHPDPRAFFEAIAAADLESVDATVSRALAGRELIEFARFDVAVMLRKHPDTRDARALRFLVGNPLIMNELGRYAPEAGSYAPITVLVDQRSDGVHVSYDRMVSLLDLDADPRARAAARSLDDDVEKLLRAITLR